MDYNSQLLPQRSKVPLVTKDRPAPDDAAVVATRDPDVIREWAEQHGAEPATGEASPSGDAVSMAISDGGAGIRFNFPGMRRLRQITWDEWLAHFERERLTLVFEPDASPRGPRYRLVRADDWDGRIGE